MRTLWALLPLLIAISANANDTLTFRRIYSFEVGDIFDYQHTTANELAQQYASTFVRKQVTGKHFSVNQDTVFYDFSGATEFYTNLDSPAVLTLPYDTAACSFNFNDQTFPGIVSNQLACYPSLTRYSERLGKTFDGQEGYYDGTYYMADFTRLIYYNNGTDSFGTPYNIAMDAGQLNSAKITDVQLSGNDGSGNLLIQNASSGTYALITLSGAIAAFGNITTPTYQLQLPNLSPALYLLHISKGNQNQPFIFKIPINR